MLSAGLPGGRDEGILDLWSTSTFLEFSSSICYMELSNNLSLHEYWKLVWHVIDHVAVGKEDNGAV